jgi:hypothetical protein
MTHWRKFDDPKYMGAYYLDEGKDLTVEIEKVTQGVAKNKQGEQKKGLLYFKGHSKPLLLNTVNGTTIQRLLKSEQVEDWIGKRITLFLTREDSFGVKDVLVIRVRGTLPPAATQTSPPTNNLPVLDIGHEKWEAAVQSVKDGKTTLERILKEWKIPAKDLVEFNRLTNEPKS